DVVKVVGGYTSGLMAVGTHLIDLLHQLFGDVEWVIALKEDVVGIDSLWYSENYHPNDPPVSGILGFKTGIIGQVYASCRTNYPFFELEIFAREGRITIQEWSTSYLIETHKLESIDNRKELRLQNRITSRANNLMMSAIQDIITSLEQGKPTLSPGEDGLRVMRTIEGLEKSCHNQGKVIKLGDDS
ncbi:Gfo/Idh/MocA family oxidoreductase, partial [Chloroflexota bacterium]